MYGHEIVIDVYNCDPKKFNRGALLEFFGCMCQRLKLKPERLHWWDYGDPEEKAAAPSHLKGTSAIQFIETSNLTVHTLDDLGMVFINLFSCGEPNDEGIDALADWCQEFFKGESITLRVLQRGEEKEMGQ